LCEVSGSTGWKVQHSAGDRPVEPWQHTAMEHDAIVPAGWLHRTRIYVNAIMKPDNLVGADRDPIIVLLGNL
jgi:hypothetical protein